MATGKGSLALALDALRFQRFIIRESVRHQVMVESLLEELELMGYLEIRDGGVFASRKAEVKFNDFKASLSTEERKALEI